MPKSTKKCFSLFGQWGRIKMFTWTKVAGNLMKCLNPLHFFFTVWLMGGGVLHARPPLPHHHLKLWQENFLSPKSQVDFWGGGGGGYGMPDQSPTPPPPQTLTRQFSKSKKSSWVLGWWWWSVWHARPPHPHHPKVSQEDFLSPKGKV